MDLQPQDLREPRAGVRQGHEQCPGERVVLVAGGCDGDVCVRQGEPVLLARSRPLYLQVGEDVWDAQALLCYHIVEGCSYYAEVSRHAVRGEVAQQVVPQVAGVLSGNLLEGSALYLLLTVDLRHVLTKSHNTLPDLSLRGGGVALEVRAVPQGCVEGHFILLKLSVVNLLYHCLGHAPSFGLATEIVEVVLDLRVLRDGVGQNNLSNLVA